MFVSGVSVYHVTENVHYCPSIFNFRKTTVNDNRYSKIEASFCSTTALWQTKAFEYSSQKLIFIHGADGFFGKLFEKLVFKIHAFSYACSGSNTIKKLFKFKLRN